MPTLLRPRLSYQPSGNEDLVLIWLRCAAYSREQDTPAYKGKRGWNPLWKAITHVIKVPVIVGMTSPVSCASLGMPVVEIITCRWVSGGSQPRSTGCRVHHKCLPWSRPPCGATSATSWRTLSSDLSCPRTSAHEDAPLNQSSGLYHKDCTTKTNEPDAGTPGTRKMVTLAPISC